MRKVGIVCGFGLETDLSFIKNIVTEHMKLSSMKPEIVVDFASYEKEAESEVVKGNRPIDFSDAIKKSVENLDKLNVDFIVIPCNTAHYFLNTVDDDLKKKIKSIIEVTVNYCVENNFKKVGIIATSTTLKENLYKDYFLKNSIDYLSPINQKEIDQTIVNILANQYGDDETKILHQALDELIDFGCEVVILGCTDLFFAIDENKYKKKVINSKQILEDYVIANLN